MYCVKSQQYIEDQIKKSRFIGIIAPCNHEQEALSLLKQLHNDYPDASHIVYAYRIKTDQGIIYRFHDAGEPTGTAGKPIFQQIDGKALINVLLVVVRYFGGIKLGAGGLTRAYSNTAKHIIEAADIAPYVEWVMLSMTLAYHQLQEFQYTLKKLDGLILSQDFAEQIHLNVQLPKVNSVLLKQAYPAIY
ncbi:MAG: IMPACT family protein [Methylovulum sp.]|jgi:uncharacterized YigZ family protein|nr:IMPACT family protein [Methylovulum sp.]MCF7998918.1 IMPACT family protein [Methylovulum sp.]